MLRQVYKLELLVERVGGVGGGEERVYITLFPNDFQIYVSYRKSDARYI